MSYNSTRAFLFRYFLRYRYSMLAIIILSLLWPLAEVAIPIFVKFVINIVAEADNQESIAFYALLPKIALLGVALLMLQILHRAQGIIWLFVAPKIKADIRAEVSEKIRSYPYRSFTQSNVGGMTNKIMQVAAACESLLDILLTNILPLVVIFILSISIMYTIHPIFAGVCLLWLGLHALTLFYCAQPCAELSKQQTEAESDIAGKMSDTFGNILSVRAFCREKHEARYLERYQAIEISKAKRAMWHIEKLLLYQGITAILMMIGVIVLALYCWSLKIITVGDIPLMIMLFFNLTQSLWSLGFIISSLFDSIGTIKAALSLLNISNEVAEKENAKKLQLKLGVIEFENVTFYHQPENALFHQLNLTLGSQEKIAIVGLSGSGKTTFMRLILRFYDVNEGRVLIDNQDIRDVTLESLREQISVISQDTILFHRTIKENIAYGRLNATMEDIIKAAKFAECHEFIMQLKDGYNTSVGEFGARLSGGQRQRIAIARAILKDSPIVIFDEPTSSQDAITELYIHRNLRAAMKDKLLLYITHQTHTLQYFDRVLVYSEGKVIEQGHVNDLIALKGNFYKIWKAQMEGFSAA